MQKQRSGKALSLVIVIVWIAAIAGGVYGYVTYQAAVAKAEKEEADRLAAESAPEAPKLKGLQVPGLVIPEGAGDAPKRTKPFQFIFSDMASTKARSSRDLSKISYSAEVQSEEAFNAGTQKLMFQGVEHFREANNSIPEAASVADLLKKVIESSLSSAADLKPFREELETVMKDPKIGSDPFAEYVTGLVMLNAGETKLAEQLFTSAIEDHRKFDYPARFAVLAFNQRAKTKPEKMIRYNEDELYVDAIVCWLQDDFSESPEEHRQCWAILQEAISNLATNGKFELVKKIIDKNEEKLFIAPWLGEMIAAHFYIQTGKVNFASDEVIENATKHLNAALKINPNFPEPKQDLEIVAKLASPGE